MTAMITSPTEPQIAEVKMLVEHVVRMSGVDFDGLQRLIEKGGEFQNGLIPLITRLSRKENPYADEKEEQDCFYPEGWTVAPLPVQADRLASAFPGLDIAYQDPGSEPLGDGFALIPKLSAIARIAGFADPYGAGYGRVVEHVLGLIGQSRRFTNCRDGELGPDDLRINAETRVLLKTLEAETPGDCLVLSFSFGNDYAGFSARNARLEALHSNQLPLGAAQVGSLLLAMPDRLTHIDHLWLDCPGDEYDWSRDGKWASYPCFYFKDGKVEFNTGWSSNADSYYGSVVAFLGK